MVVKEISYRANQLTFQALTFGNGASTNLTAPSDEVVVALPALAVAFASSVDEFAFSAPDEFPLLEVLLSPAERTEAKPLKYLKSEVHLRIQSAQMH